MLAVSFCYSAVVFANQYTNEFFLKIVPWK